MPPVVRICNTSCYITYLTLLTVVAQSLQLYNHNNSCSFN